MPRALPRPCIAPPPTAPIPEPQPKQDTWGRLASGLLSKVPFLHTDGNHEVEQVRYHLGEGEDLLAPALHPTAAHPMQTRRTAPVLCVCAPHARTNTVAGARRMQAHTQFQRSVRTALPRPPLLFLRARRRRLARRRATAPTTTGTPCQRTRQLRTVRRGAAYRCRLGSCHLALCARHAVCKAWRRRDSPPRVNSRRPASRSAVG